LEIADFTSPESLTSEKNHRPLRSRRKEGREKLLLSAEEQKANTITLCVLGFAVSTLSENVYWQATTCRNRHLKPDDDGYPR
jgi:hypothetical protein